MTIENKQSWWEDYETMLRLETGCIDANAISWKNVAIPIIMKCKAQHEKEIAEKYARIFELETAMDDFVKMQKGMVKLEDVIKILDLHNIGIEEARVRIKELANIPQDETQKDNPALSQRLSGNDETMQETKQQNMKEVRPVIADTISPADKKLEDAYVLEQIRQGNYKSSQDILICLKCRKEFKTQDEAIEHSKNKNHYEFNIGKTNLKLMIAGEKGEYY
jgi:uncharacterized C2H2 Zn-finger protein